MFHFAGFASMHFLFVHHFSFPTPFYTEHFKNFYGGLALDVGENFTTWLITANATLSCLS